MATDDRIKTDRDDERILGDIDPEVRTPIPSGDSAGDQDIERRDNDVGPDGTRNYRRTGGATGMDVGNRPE
jgi:hypothetical protein